jgi:hypothetical protein
MFGFLLGVMGTISSTELILKKFLSHHSTWGICDVSAHKHIILNSWII